METKPHAVFFQSSTLHPSGVDDQTIHVFDDEAAAEEFVFGKLVEIGEIKETRDGIFVADEPCDTKAQAITFVHEGFGGLEYFHIYPAVDHREQVCRDENGTP